MTDHLRPEDFIDALEGAGSPAAQAHLAACAICREELSTLRSVTSDVEAVEAHEPSPLFWDHFSARVRAATDAESHPVAWWRTWVRPVGVLAGAVAVVLLMILFRPAVPIEVDPGSSTSVTSGTIASLDPLDDGPSWGMVVDAASALTSTDVREVTEPAAGTADAMIDELTAAQRDELIRLLQKEMGAL